MNNTATKIDKKWMARCLQLASLGLGSVQPNPLVGAVIIHNQRIIGEGWHQKYGEPHAEVNAIHAVKECSLLSASTLYVNLEPCSHHGKTPPCTDIIIQYKIPKVVIGTKDPNLKVNGNGIKQLEDAGIIVVEQVLEKECKILNKRFFTYHQHRRPYIILKWAQTRNNYMDIPRKNNQISKPYWITNETLRVFTHKMRNEEQAIMIGYNTYINDHPQLTNRLYGSRLPARFVFCNLSTLSTANEQFTFLSGSIEDILKKLYDRNIQSVIIEGGKKILEKFLTAGVWDEAFIFTGNQEWKAGISSPQMKIDATDEYCILDNYVRHYLKN